jgi:hypothetical protein
LREGYLPTIDKCGAKRNLPTDHYFWPLKRYFTTLDDQTSVEEALQAYEQLKSAASRSVHHKD